MSGRMDGWKLFKETGQLLPIAGGQVHCRPQVQACITEVGRLESDGSPDAGANNRVISDALVSLAITPELEAGDEFVVKNACGAVCVNYKDCDRLKRLNLAMTICTPDPFLMELLVAGTVLTSGTARGFAYPELNAAACANGVSIQVWVKRVTEGSALDPIYPYARWVLPRAYLFPGPVTFENNAQQPQFTGFAVENDEWLDGPQNDWPVASNRVAQWLPVVTLPSASCGYQTQLAS